MTRRFFYASLALATLSIGCVITVAVGWLFVARSGAPAWTQSLSAVQAVRASGSNVLVATNAYPDIVVSRLEPSSGASVVIARLAPPSWETMMELADGSARWPLVAFELRAAPDAIPTGAQAVSFDGEVHRFAIPIDLGARAIEQHGEVIVLFGADEVIALALDGRPRWRVPIANAEPASGVRNESQHDVVVAVGPDRALVLDARDGARIDTIATAPNDLVFHLDRHDARFVREPISGVEVRRRGAASEVLVPGASSWTELATGLALCGERVSWLPDGAASATGIASVPCSGFLASTAETVIVPPSAARSVLYSVDVHSREVRELGTVPRSWFPTIFPGQDQVAVATAEWAILRDSQALRGYRILASDE